MSTLYSEQLNTYSLITDINRSMFRAYDIRGIASEILTEDSVYTIAVAIASKALSQNVAQIIIARDGRLSSPALFTALQCGLVNGGCDVIDIGIVPTPLLYFATHYLTANSGIMLTGSHNPKNYNGLKIILNGQGLTEQDIMGLYQSITAGEISLAKIPGHIVTETIIDAYIESIAQFIQLSRPLRVVVDAGNGVAGVVAPQLYERLGCEVIPLYCEVDGHFPNHHPDPSQEKNLIDLITMVKQQAADIGLAFDGDADRLGVVSKTGEIIHPDQQMIVFAQEVLSRHPGAEIIYDVKCTRHLANAITAVGGKATMWKAGHSLMRRKLKESGAPLAGEMSGHIFFADRWYSFDDGMYAGSRMLEIIANDDEVLVNICHDIITPELFVPIADEEKFAFMQQLQQQGQFPQAEKITIDGLRLEFPHGWALIRSSNTTPNLTVRFEADTETHLHTIQDLCREQLLKLKPDLNLPF